MSCICQYYTSTVNTAQELVAFTLENAAPEKQLTEGQPAAEISASDLADCRAENWLLKKKLVQYEVTIENLEQLVTTIVDKQHQILSEMFQLRKENRELQIECHQQRDYHSMERNALLKELHDAQTLSRNRLLASKCDSSHIPSDMEDDYDDEKEEEETESDDLEYDSYEALDSDNEDEFSTPSSSGSSSPSSTDSETEDTDSEDDENDDKVDKPNCYSTDSASESD